MSTTITPNMNLPVPTTGSEPGPDYANDVNSCFGIVDIHTHAAGSGVQITPAGLNLNSDVTFQSNDAIALRSTRYTAQGSPIAAGTDLGCIYVSGVDLYFNDINGNQIRITQSAAVAGTPGSISNLVSPATASYAPSTGTFVFQSGASIPGNGDFASVTLREQVASPNGVTLASPLSLAANYTITMPASAPASQKFVTMDASGNLAAPWTTDNSTVEISTNTLRVKPLGITAAQIANATITTTQIASSTIVNGNIANATITQAKMAGFLGSIGTVTTITATGPYVVPSGVTQIHALVVSGGGGGGGGTGGGSGGGGGGGGAVWQGFLTVVPGETITVTIGDGGTFGTPGNPGAPGTASTLVGSTSGNLVSPAAGTAGGGGGGAGSPGAGGLGGGNGDPGGVGTGSAGAGGTAFGFGRLVANDGGAGSGTATFGGGGGGGSYGAGASGGAPGGTAAANTGGGGGGGNGTNRNGGVGGSGIVIITVL